MVTYALLVHDRHSDPGVHVFTDATAAVEAAYAFVSAFAHSPRDIDAQQHEGYVVWIDYSPEDDYVAVIECPTNPSIESLFA
jgi:hypothetical protein